MLSNFVNVAELFKVQPNKVEGCVYNMRTYEVAIVKRPQNTAQKVARRLPNYKLGGRMAPCNINTVKKP